MRAPRALKGPRAMVYPFLHLTPFHISSPLLNGTWTHVYIFKVLGPASQAPACPDGGLWSWCAHEVSLRERTSWACGAQPGGTWPPCGAQAHLAPLLAEVTYTHTLWREHTFPSHRVCYWYDSWLAAVQSSYAIGLTALHMCHHSTSSEGLEPVDPLKAVERTHML